MTDRTAWVARAFAAHVRRRDAAAAAGIERQAADLEAGVRADRPSDDLRLWFADDLPTNVTVIPGVGAREGELHVFVYDDDDVSLGGRAHRGPDAHAHDALAELERELRPFDLPRVASFHLLVLGSLRCLARLAERGLAARITHLTVRCDAREAAALSDVCPSLIALQASSEVAEALLDGGHAGLARVVLDGASAAQLARVLRRHDLPALRHVGTRHAPTTEDDLTMLAREVARRRVARVELVSTNDAAQFPFDRLWDLRPALADVECVVVSGHLVPPRIVRRFAAWEAVVFASHDRRELLAWDLEASGWPHGSR